MTASSVQRPVQARALARQDYVFHGAAHPVDRSSGQALRRHRGRGVGNSGHGLERVGGRP
ncbi:hypothetical protein [Amycolatopsis sp. WAC 01376]|uniref:hypothetical protein n=1 Tax=Amycolatopsis sp. WAC 01376 TaxID=2203195 RepID=UPI000F79C6E5|nr:hypothetical protein [Amycolatopsis sp. WAC 01376]